MVCLSRRDGLKYSSRVASGVTVLELRSPMSNGALSLSDYPTAKVIIECRRCDKRGRFDKAALIETRRTGRSSPDATPASRRRSRMRCGKSHDGGRVPGCAVRRALSRACHQQLKVRRKNPRRDSGPRRGLSGFPQHRGPGLRRGPTLIKAEAETRFQLGCK